ncbi:MAG: hypothetical protein CMN30_24270 [Sandaracinus sp.]|nr:hypothetical protein [Sandaracinus sp.]
MGSEREEAELDGGEATAPDMKIPDEVRAPSRRPPPLPGARVGPPPLPGQRASVAPEGPKTEPAPPMSADPSKPPARLGRSVAPPAPWKPKGPGDLSRPPGAMRPSAPPPPASAASRALKTTVRLKKPSFPASTPAKPAAPRIPSAPPRPLAPPRPVESPRVDPLGATTPPARPTSASRPMPPPARAGVPASRPAAPPPGPAVRPSTTPGSGAASDSMTLGAVQARLRAVELDGADQRKALEALEARVGATETESRSTSGRVKALEAAGGAAADERLASMEARVAEVTRLQLELAAHDDRLDGIEERATRDFGSVRDEATALAGELRGRLVALEEAPAPEPAPPSSEPGSNDELLALDERLGALESRAPDDGLRHRLEAAEAGLADAQRALATVLTELSARDAALAALTERLEALEARSAAAVPPRSKEASATPSGVPLAAVKGIGPKLSKRLFAAGLVDAAALATADDHRLDELSTETGIQRGRLERLRDAASELVG